MRVGKMMNKLTRISFHIKWLFLAPEERYAFLWDRTNSKANKRIYN